MVMTSRRTFVAAVVAGVLRVLRYAAAQQPSTSTRIGVLAAFGGQSIHPLLATLRDGLRERGWIEGQNLHVEYSYDMPGGPSLDERAAKLATANLQLIVADSTPSSLALERANVSIPVGSSPSRFVRSRPVALQIGPLGGPLNRSLSTGGW